MRRWPLVTTFVLFIAVCISAAYWGMQFFKPPLRAVAAPPQAEQYIPRFDAAAVLFGVRKTVVVASNYQLKGVVVASKVAESVAILATAGKPAQAFRTNSEVEPGVTLKEVHPGYVLLSEGNVEKRVELPKDAKMRAGVNIPAGEFN